MQTGSLMSSGKKNQQTQWVLYQWDWNFEKELNRHLQDEKLIERDQERSGSIGTIWLYRKEQCKNNRPIRRRVEGKGNRAPIQTNSWCECPKAIERKGARIPEANRTPHYLNPKDLLQGTLY